jgi:hypothetical protein
LHTQTQNLQTDYFDYKSKDKTLILEAKINNNRELIEENAAAIASNTDAIGTLGAQLTIATTAITSNTTAIASNTTDIEAVNDQLEYLEATYLQRFYDFGDGTIRDNSTGLVWLKDAHCSAISMNRYSDAVAAVASLADGQCGLNDGSSSGDWRLPTIEEYEALVHLSFTDPALSDTEGHGHWSQGDAFTNVQNWYYWSSDYHSTSGEHHYQWAMDMRDGTAVGWHFINFGGVWAVRIGQ